MKKVTLICLVGMCVGCGGYGGDTTLTIGNGAGDVVLEVRHTSPNINEAKEAKFIAIGPVISSNSTEGQGRGIDFLRMGVIPIIGVTQGGSVIEYDDVVLYRANMQLVSAPVSRPSGFSTYLAYGLGAHVSDALDYGLGVEGSAGVAFTAANLKGLGLGLKASAYSWLGAKDKKFDTGVEASASAMLVWAF